MRPHINLLLLNNTPIFEQLALEEALFRTSADNWCLINSGSPPAIVLGLSQKKEEMVDQENASKQHIPLIRRFSGGGTVLIDEDTLFFTLIFNHKDAIYPIYPQNIHQWVHTCLLAAFLPYNLLLREHDFALHDKKIGGTAQSISKNRLVHHTSFLWSWKAERLALLRHPLNEPLYRAKRTHEHFMGRLSDHFHSLDQLQQQVIHCLEQQYAIHRISRETASEFLTLPHRKATSFELV